MTLEQIQKWLAGSPYASFLRTFCAVVFFQAITEFQSTGAIVFDNWQKWVIAGLVAVAVSAGSAASRYYNPADKAFGQTS